MPVARVRMASTRDLAAGVALVRLAQMAHLAAKVALVLPHLSREHPSHGLAAVAIAAAMPPVARVAVVQAAPAETAQVAPRILAAAGVVPTQAPQGAVGRE